MAEWPQVLLGDLVEIKHGFAFDGRYFVDEPTSDLLATPGNFAIGGGFKLEKPKYYRGPVPSEYILQRGDLIVTMTDLSKSADTLGYGAIVPDLPGLRLLHNQRIGRVLVKRRDVADPAFLHWVLRTRAYRDEVLGTASGSTVKHTAPSRIAAHQFPLPPLAEQRSIARILGSLDDKIELNRRMNETLEAMARALFKSWFVDFDPVRAKMRGEQPTGLDAATAALFPSRLVKTEHGEVPEGWARSSLAKIADALDCLHSMKPERVTEGHNVLLQLNNIGEAGVLLLDDRFLISDCDYETWSRKFEAAPGDCVITNVGRVGAVAQVPSGVTAALGRNMTGLRCKADAPWPTFLLEALLSDAMRIEIRRNTDVGTILDALNVRSIPKLGLVVPSRAVAQQFERLARPLRARIEQSVRESGAIREVRDTLLPRLISGELRVPDADRIAEAAA